MIEPNELYIIRLNRIKIANNKYRKPRFEAYQVAFLATLKKTTNVSNLI